MHLLYCDESGTTADPGQKHFVLAGVSMFERQSYWLSSRLDSIAARFNPGDPNSLELHGNAMLAGRNFWRKYPLIQRSDAIKEALSAFNESHISNKLFACIVRKEAVSPYNPVQFAFEQLCSRFDHYLMRLHKNGDTQRGIIIFDKSTYEKTIQNLV